MRRRGFAASLLAAAVISLAPQSQAGALYFYEMSNASESGYGGAGLAVPANDARTVFANPAGMSLFGESAMLAGGTGVYVVAIPDQRTQYRDRPTRMAPRVENRSIDDAVELLKGNGLEGLAQAATEGLPKGVGTSRVPARKTSRNANLELTNDSAGVKRKLPDDPIQRRVVPG